MKHLILFLIFFCLFTTAAQSQINSPADDPLRVIAIFAHPDDADFKMAGTAIQMAQAGHQVKYLSITNGNAGHHEMGGGVLAKRRRAESQEAARRTGIAEYEVWDYDDAKLMPTLDIRMEVIRAIREWNADVVLGLRPNDYHPDHRNAGKLVIDASYMVIVPNVVSDTPPLENNPVFLYMQDGFSKPNPFSHDIVVGFNDDVFETKARGLDAHESQVYEWMPWTSGMLDQVPEDEEERFEWLKTTFLGWSSVSYEQRSGLEKWYGAERATEFKYAESFEIAEYGHYPTDEEIRMIFPMLD